MNANRRAPAARPRWLHHIAAGPLLAGFVLLTACGFHLRGSGQPETFPQELQTLRLGGALTPLSIELRHALREQAAVRLAEDSAVGVPQLVITAETSEALPWALDRAGATSGSLINYRVQFMLYGPKNEKWIEPQSVKIQRDLAADKFNPLGVERQAEFLGREMRRDAIQQIPRRLAQFRPGAAARPSGVRDPDPGERGGVPGLGE